MKHKQLFSTQMMILVFHFISLLYLLQNLDTAVGLGDTLFPGKLLSYKQKLVSKGSVFQLGFIGEPDTKVVYHANVTFPVSYYNYYMAISFQKSPNTVIWEANRNKPISEPEFLALELSPSGDLTLTQPNSSIWAIRSSDEISYKPVSTVLVLHDSGNLVLRDAENSSRVIWQSFDHPTHTWLAGAPLGFNSVTGKTISLSQYDYSLEIDPSRTHGFIIKKAYSISDYYGSFPRWLDIRKLHGNSLVRFDDAREPYLFIQLKLGQVSILQWVHNSDTLKTLWYAPGSRYNFDSLCNQYNSCRPARDLCSGPNIVQPTSPNDDGDQSHIAGCSSNISLNSQTTRNCHYFNTFDLITNIDKYPDNPQILLADSESACEAACFSNCSCSAYAWQLDNNNCNFWFGELLNGIVQDDVGDKLIKVRVHGSKGSKPSWIFILVIGFVLSLGVGLLFCWRHKGIPFLAKQPKVETHLVVYSYSHMKSITRNFSSKLGEGGFGTVFQGWMRSSTIVAVKKLKSKSSDEKQFRTEVRTIGMIHHTNLVKLIGFCSENARQMLVYEYMTYGSLDNYLFSNGRYVINWKTRYQIILGVAKGLAYLHQDCVDCIIHCDIKPENILLDENFCPKIADFGMAKLLSRDFSRVLTTMRGTIGYLAPEWLSGEPITQKADVYSFGLMLFEIISGKRNWEKLKDRECTYFPLYAAIKVNQGDLLCLLDDKLEGIVNFEDLDIACKVACWCIQDWEMHRPSMGQVVRMLEGIVRVEMPPVPRTLLNIVDNESDFSHSTFA